MSGVLNTRWEVNEAGDLICEFEGDPSWCTTSLNSIDLDGPTKLGIMKLIAGRMNYAYQEGIKAKQNEFKEILGLREFR